MTEEIFRVTDPAGKTYKIYANGQIEGFGEGCVVFNRIPIALKLASAGSADLLAALKAVFTHDSLIYDGGSYVSLATCDHSTLQPLREQVRAAIAKAEE